ncbi:RDD family protein [Streptomyces sp. NPDC049813]|uniref:RDD family protein n=1 Tax=Streptomyces sp. NPDC049813 TaxID=3365597 RepID=UPI00378E9D99
MSAPTPAPGDDRPREGYYPDPSIPGYVRYWNGAAWVPGTSRPAPSEGESLPVPAGSAPAAPAPGPVEETGPVFLDEEPSVRTETGSDDPDSPEPATAWAADTSHQSGFGGEQDRRVSWGAGPAGTDPREPTDPAAAPEPPAAPAVPARTDGNVAIRAVRPGAGAPPRGDGTMTIRAVPQQTAGRTHSADQPQATGQAQAQASAQPQVSGQPQASGPAQASGQPQASAQPQVSGPAQASGQPQASAQPQASGQPQVSGPAQVSGQPQLSGQARVAGQSPAAGQDQFSGQVRGSGQPQAPGQPQPFAQAQPPAQAQTPAQAGSQPQSPAPSQAPVRAQAGSQPQSPAPSQAPVRAQAGSQPQSPARSQPQPQASAPAPAPAQAAAPASPGLHPQPGYGYPPPAGAQPAAAGAPQGSRSGYGYPPPQPAYGYPQPAASAAPAVATPVTQGPGGGSPSWAQQVHQLATPEQAAEPQGPVTPFKPVAADPFLAAAQAQASARPAGLGKRLLARLVDSLVLGAVTAAVAVPLGTRALDHIDGKIDAAKASGRQVTVWLLDGTTATYLGIVLAVLLVFGVLYEALPTAKWGRTLGKKLLGLSVREIEGSDSPSFGAALRRWLAYAVPGVLLIGVIGVLWGAIDRPWRQCLHDKIARTFVAG